MAFMIPNRFNVERGIISPSDSNMSSTASIQDSRLISPANGTNSSNLNDNNSPRCQHADCSSLILTSGNYCMRHKKSESPMKLATNATASQPYGTREIDSKVPSQPVQSPRVNGHPVEAFSEGKSGDAITVNTSRQPMQPANSKKQLPGKNIARKSAGVSRSTPRTGYSPEGSRTSGTKVANSASFPDPRPGKRSRLSSINNDGVCENNPTSTECGKPNGTTDTTGEEISLRLKQKTDAKAPKPRQSNGAIREIHAPKPNTEEKRPPDREGGIVSPSIRDDRHHKVLTKDQDSSKLYNSHTTKTNGVMDTGGPKDAPAHSNPRKHREVQPVPYNPPMARSNKECSIFKGMHPIRKNTSASSQVPTHPSRGHKSSGSDRNSEPLQSKKLHQNEMQGIPNYTNHGTTRPEPAPGAAVLTNGSNGVSSVHTQARFIVQTPLSQNGQHILVPEPAPASPVANGGTDSDDTPLTRNTSKARFLKGLPASFKGKSATSHPTIEPSSSRATSVTTNEARKVNGVGLHHAKDHPSNQMKLHPQNQNQKSLGIAELRKQRIENHDPEKFDSYIYGKPNEPFRPGSSLFDIPWYEQPLRPVRPATHFGYFDPRVHWSQPKPEQWYRDKREEIRQRGGRKVNVGKAATTLSQRKLRDQKTDRRVNLPDRVANNPQWVKALDELDDMTNANQLRLLKDKAEAKAGAASGVGRADRNGEGVVGVGTDVGELTGPKKYFQHRQSPQLQPQPQPQPQFQQQPQLQPQQLQEHEHEHEHELADREEHEKERAVETHCSDNEEVEYESPSKARRRRREGGAGGRGGRKKGKARATSMIVDEDYDGGDDEYMGVVSDLQ